MHEFLYGGPLQAAMFLFFHVHVFIVTINYVQQWSNYAVAKELNQHRVDKMIWLRWLRNRVRIHFPKTFVLGERLLKNPPKTLLTRRCTRWLLVKLQYERSEPSDSLQNGMYVIVLNESDLAGFIRCTKHNEHFSLHLMKALKRSKNYTRPNFHPKSDPSNRSFSNVVETNIQPRISRIFAYLG